MTFGTTFPSPVNFGANLETNGFDESVALHRKHFLNKMMTSDDRTSRYLCTKRGLAVHESFQKIHAAVS